MKVCSECYPCLQNLTRQTLRLCCEQKPSLLPQQACLEQTLLAYLEKNFCRQRVPAALFTRIHEQIKKHTVITDAFGSRKQEELTLAGALTKPARWHRWNLRQCLQFSAAGNSLDFFKTVDCSAAEMRQRIRLYLDHRHAFEQRIPAARTVLFFADNAGECFFDLPLIHWLRRRVRVNYIVKSLPVQNDLTLADLDGSTISGHFPRVLGTGNGAVGIETATISRTLRRALRDADIIIAKGMGYYETFSELRRYRPKLFHLLMAKCLPVARSISVPINSYVFFTASKTRSLRR